MVKVNYLAIGQRIKEKRKEAGLNQKELAAKVGLSEASVSKYENGKVEDATHVMLAKFADVLGVPVSWLLGIEAEPEEAPATDPCLSPEELRLLSYFRALNSEGRAFLLQSAEVALNTYSKGKGEATKPVKEA